MDFGRTATAPRETAPPPAVTESRTTGSASALGRMRVPQFGRQEWLQLALSISLSYMLCGTTLIAANAPLLSARPPVVTLNVDWPPYLARHDPVWLWGQQQSQLFVSEQSPPSTWEKSLYGGNAMLGFMMWQPDNRTVRVDVGRADLYDDRTQPTTPFTGDFVYDRPRLPIGHILLQFNAPFTGGSGRLSLWNAEAQYNVSTVSHEGAALTTTVRVWASAQHELTDTLVLEVGGAKQVDAVRWVSEPGNSLWMARTVAKSTVSCASRRMPKCDCGNRGAGYGLCKSCPNGCDSDAGCVLCNNYVPNPEPQTVSTSTPELGMLNITTQTHLRGTAHSTAVLQLPDRSTFAVSVSPVSDNSTAADLWAKTQVCTLATVGVEHVRAAHRRWWHAFWPAGGLVTYEYTVLESLFVLMQYKFASAARRGRAFMDLNGPWLVTVDGGTNAPDIHWDWNIQGMYYMPFLTNRPEISNSLVDYMEHLLNSGVLWSSSNVQPAWQDSAAAPTGASGLDGQQSCYWNDGVNCTVSPPSVTGNLLWTLHVVHETGIYQGNSTVLTAVVWPLLCRALRFYGHFMIENSTHITLPPTFSPEYPGPAGPNANYDLALLRWGVKAAIQITKQYNLTALPADESLWNRLTSKLIGPSLDAEGRFAIYDGTPYATPHRHFSHLLPLWPLRELGNLSDTVEYHRAVASIDLWSSMPELFSLFGRPACASMNADVGRYAAALDNMSYFVRTRVEGAGWYFEGAATVCNEATYMAAYTLADWLLQSWNETSLAGPGLHGARVKVIEPFRGIPDSVKLDGSAYDAAPAAIATGSFFKLAAEGGFLVSAVRHRVNPQNLTVYKAKTSFIAIESTIGGPCVLRTTMQRPLRTHPAGVQITELGDDLVKIGIQKGESVALWGGDSTIPLLEVRPKEGCETQQNYWGGGVAPQPESRQVPAPSPALENRTVLRPCLFGADGALAPSQRWLKVERAGGSVGFQLQDGSGRCLSASECPTKTGPAVLRPCVQHSIPSSSVVRDTVPLAIGCQGPWTQEDEWPRLSGTIPGTACNVESQEFVVGGVAPHFWRNAVQVRGTNNCLDLHGGKDPDTISLDGCQNCTAAHQCTVDNTEWHYNGSSMALVSLCKPPCQAGGWCLSDAAAHPNLTFV